MGYDVHITRRQEWHEETGPEITLAEWTALVQADPEMRLDGLAQAATTEGEVLRIDDPGMAVWTAWTGHGVGGNMAWIWHADGNVVAKNPAAEFRVKMWHLAQALGARVQGDDSECYGADGEAIADDAPTPAARKPWWRIW